MHGYDMYDSEARMYYPAIMRTPTMDPHAESYYSTSPYAWCGNNPVNRIDPTGMDWFVSNIPTTNDDPVWLPSINDANSYYGNDGYINLGENLLNQLEVTPQGSTMGNSFEVPSYLLNAKGEYGQKDSEHANQMGMNPRVLEYHATTQNPETGKPYTSDMVAWCASFVNWNVIQAGLIGNNNKFNATAASYNKWNETVTQIKKPALGAIAVINSSHVTFVVGINGKNIHGYGGNQSNQVKVSTYYNPKSVKYFMPINVIPNYNVPNINHNFNKQNESTR